MDTFEKGTRSKDILDNPLVKEAFSTIKQALIEEWENQSDPSAREEVWYTLKGLERFKGLLETNIDNAMFDSTMQEDANE